MRRAVVPFTFVALAVAGCGASSRMLTVTRPPITVTATTTTLPAPPPQAAALKVSRCDYNQPTAAACEQVPAAGACHFRIENGATLPDPACTPGAVNPAVTPATARSTICVAGYTTRIRPPLSYTSPLKRKILAAYGLPSASPASYELDHLIPLEAGGAPSDPANLWPQPYAPTPGAHEKDDEENYLRTQACHHNPQLLPSLQAGVAADWFRAWQHDRPTHIVFGATPQQ